jgi:alkylation response protein AidB-like acyl-CoA dehydrogenase
MTDAKTTQAEGRAAPATTGTPRRGELRELIRDFAEREIPRELARSFDVHENYPHALLGRLGEMGVMGATIAEAYGGLGGDVRDAMAIYEELSRRLPVLAWVAGNIMLYGNDIIATSGSAEQQACYLPELARGRLKFAFALTEPDAGSDAANLSTRAALGPDGRYRLNGSKMFITGAGVSDIVVTLTRTAPDKYRGLTAFLVDTRSPGYSASPLEKLGYRSSNTCAVHYEDVAVAPDRILGGAAGLNQGWSQMMKLLNRERLALSACALGIGQAVVDDTVAYAKERYHLGQSRGRHQAIQHALVEMATELEAARRLAYHAAWLETQRQECVREISMSKYLTTETAKRLALRGIDLLGQDGATLEYDLQRYLRDVLVLSIGGGTTQIQKNIIARTMGLA